jgi:hypothetical protein
VFDEAYNLTEAEVAALTGAQIASPNAQTIYTSTAPVASIHAFCDIFAGVRELGLVGHRDPEAGDPELLFYEFAAPDPPKDERERAARRLDRELWRLASPSHGVISKDRDIDAIRKVLCINAAGIALWEADYLGWGEWPTTATAREPVIPIEEVWVTLTDLAPELVGQIVIAVSRTQDRERWAFAAGRRRIDGAVALELGRYEKMNIGQAARYLLQLIQRFDPPEVVIEGHDPGIDLVPVMRKLGVDMRVTTANEFAIASAAFIDHAFSGDMCHTGQPIIREGLEQAAMRELPRGDRVFDTKEGSIAQVIAFVLALWGVLEFAEEDTPAALPVGGGEVAAVDDLPEFGEHLLHRHFAQHLGRGEQLIRRDRQFARPVRGPHPRAAHRRPSSAQGHRPAFAAVPHRRARRIVPALRAGQLGHVGLHQRLHDLQADAHGQRQQALLHVLGDLAHRHTDPPWKRGRARVHGPNLATLLHGGPLALGVLGGTPDTYYTAGLERGTATSTSTRPGSMPCNSRGVA